MQRNMKMMTYDEARTFLLQLNTDKQLNESEHEAIRVAVRVLDDVTTASDTCHTCYKAGQEVFAYKMRRFITNMISKEPENSKFVRKGTWLSTDFLIGYIDGELEKIEED